MRCALLRKLKSCSQNQTLVENDRVFETRANCLNGLNSFHNMSLYLAFFNSQLGGFLGDLII